MHLKELVRKNRSYRIFDQSVPISRQLLEDWVDTARFANSSINRQPLRFYLSCDQATNDKIFPLTRWAGLLKDFDGPGEGERPTAYILICVDSAIAPNPAAFDKDVGLTAEILTLAAVEQGFGGCMIGSFDRQEIAKRLELDEKMLPVLLLALGKPAETVLLEELVPGASTDYYRDGKGHHVSKRPLQDLLL